MILENLARKGDFVRRELSRCVAAMCPGVVRVEYHCHDEGDLLNELALIRCADGVTRRVDVTGLGLLETTNAVLKGVTQEAAG